MRKILILTLLLIAVTVFSASCDYVKLPGYNSGEEPDEAKHSHAFDETLSDADGHYCKCSCGSVGEIEAHTDTDLDGICDVCSYTVRDLLSVTVIADGNVNISSKNLLVRRGDSLTFNVSVGTEYSVTILGAVKIFEESYGSLCIYTLTVSDVVRDVTVEIVTELIPVTECQHEWLESTCTTPTECSLCGKTDGEALGHDMSVPDCENASACSRCGKTEGEALGHDMSAPDCENASACSRCGKTDGEALGHDMSAATCDRPSTCISCGMTVGKPLSHSYKATSRIDPTCTEDGYVKYTCVCGASYKTILSATGHEGGVPSYTSEGICKNCNERYIPMLKLTYASYGAVGDGVTDDFFAIKAAHAFANENNLTIYADEGKTYYLGQHDESIVVKTNTVWNGATFIIDDRSIAATDAVRTRNVFYFPPDHSSYSVKISGGLQEGQENIGVTFDTPVLLYIANSNVKQYIRYGANANSGADQQELILVDKYGNVDPSTPIMWDYSTVTSAIAYPVGDRPITVTGGTFITRANAAPREYTYYARNISIKRSNVTIDGITHYITDEGDTGAPYSGFLIISYCNNTVVQNAVLTGHKVYKLSSNVNNSMGTYDISLNSANAVTFKNCTQTNSITDTTYWGIMGSNYCKNLTYDGCIFSRFDAHQGTYNATIINSEIGHQKLSVIGKGTLYIENTVFHSDTVVALRTDYGSTWDGEIIFKNITINNTGTPILVNAGWNNHYFGYTCYLPTKIVIDGITLANKDYFYVLPNLPSHVDDLTVNGEANKNPLQLTETIVIESNPNGYKYYVSVNKELFSNVELIVK